MQNENVGDSTWRGRLEAIIANQKEDIASLKLQLKLARRDKLTKLPGRDELIELTQKALTNAQLPTSLIFMDLNGFKKINDMMGHAIGDILLIEFAGFLNRQRKIAGENGQLITLARLHGDEFAILLPFFSADEATQFVVALKNALAKEVFVLDNRSYHLQSAMGVASTSTSGCSSAEKLLHAADLAMYEDKKRMHAIGEATSEGAP